MAKQSNKMIEMIDKALGVQPEVTAEDVVKRSGVLSEPMPLPPPAPPDEDDDEDRPLAGATLDPATVQQQILAAIQGLHAGPPSGSTVDVLERLTAAFERMAAAQLEGATRVANATDRARAAERPSNITTPMISCFNLRGDKDFPKPPLKCRMFLPWEAEHESLTREEVELLNLLEPGEYAVRRNDGTKVKITVRANYKLDSDAPSEMLVHHDTAFNNDYHRLMPADWMRQMVKQSPKTRRQADLVLTMDEEEALIAAGQLNTGHPAPLRDGKPAVVSVGE